MCDSCFVQRKDLVDRLRALFGPSVLIHVFEDDLDWIYFSVRDATIDDVLVASSLGLSLAYSGVRFYSFHGYLRRDFFEKTVD